MKLIFTLKGKYFFFLLFTVTLHRCRIVKTAGRTALHYGNAIFT